MKEEGAKPFPLAEGCRRLGGLLVPLWGSGGAVSPGNVMH